MENKEPMLCTFCNKKGHMSVTCWSKFLDKKKVFHAKGKGPAAPSTPLYSIVNEEHLKHHLLKFYKSLPPLDPSS